MNDIIKLSDRVAAKSMNRDILLDYLDHRLEYMRYDFNKFRVMLRYGDSVINEVKRLAEDAERFAIYAREFSNKCTGVSKNIEQKSTQRVSTLSGIDVEHGEDLFPQPFVDLP